MNFDLTGEQKEIQKAADDFGKGGCGECGCGKAQEAIQIHGGYGYMLE